MLTRSVRRRLFDLENQNETRSTPDTVSLSAANPAHGIGLLDGFPNELLHLIVVGFDDSCLGENDVKLIFQLALCNRLLQQLRLEAKGSMLLLTKSGSVELLRRRAVTFPFIKQLTTRVLTTPLGETKADFAFSFNGLRELDITISKTDLQFSYGSAITLVLPPHLDLLRVRSYEFREDWILEGSSMPYLEQMINSERMPRLIKFRAGWDENPSLHTDEELAMFVDHWCPWIRRIIPLAHPLDIGILNWNGQAVSTAVMHIGGPLALAALNRYNVTLIPRHICDARRACPGQCSTEFIQWALDPKAVSVESILADLPMYLYWRLPESFFTAVLAILRAKMTDIEIWNHLGKHITHSTFSGDIIPTAFNVLQYLKVGLLDGVIPPLYLATMRTTDTNLRNEVLAKRGYSPEMLKNNPAVFEFLLPWRKRWSDDLFHYAIAADPKRFAELIVTPEFYEYNTRAKTRTISAMQRFGFDELCVRSCISFPRLQTIAILFSFYVEDFDHLNAGSLAVYRRLIFLLRIRMMPTESRALPLLPDIDGNGWNPLFYIYDDVETDAVLSEYRNRSIEPSSNIDLIPYPLLVPFRYTRDRFGHCPFYYWTQRLDKALSTGIECYSLITELKSLIRWVYGMTLDLIDRNAIGEGDLVYVNCAYIPHLIPV